MAEEPSLAHTCTTCLRASELQLSSLPAFMNLSSHQRAHRHGMASAHKTLADRHGHAARQQIELKLRLTKVASSDMPAAWH